MKTRSIIALTMGIVALATATLPLLPTDFWAVRAMSFVRDPAIYAFVAAAVICVLVVRTWRFVAAAMFLCAAAINAAVIWQYTPFVDAEIDLASNAPPEKCFTALSANVKMTNRDFDRMIAQIRQTDPDILFLTEVDDSWAEALNPLLKEYPYSLSHPQSDTFGKVFASKLPVLNADILERPGEDTPSVFALVRGSDTAVVEFVGLHPKAPLPGQHTTQRDNSILRAARESEDDITGGIAMGDFNDVPWSQTMTAFRATGDWKDPRIGRGSFATFPAIAPFAGWPLDQIMVKDDVKVAAFEILDANGSDHRAVLGTFCLDDMVTRESAEAD